MPYNKLQIPSIAAAAVLFLTMTGCAPQATVSMEYATSGIGTHNAAKYTVGRVLRWVPGQPPIDLAQVAATPKDIYVAKDSRDSSSNANGFVVATNFKATAQQRAAIEAKSESNVTLQYENLRIEESNNSLGEMAAYLNAGGPPVAIDWGLEDAIASHAPDAQTAPVYYVMVYRTVETDSANLSVTGNSGLSVKISDLRQPVRVSFSDTAAIDCQGRQKCFFDIRIYQPYKNTVGNYDFKTASVAKREFLSDLATGLN